MEDALPAPDSRRALRQEARRNAILDVATQSFLENGYAGTTMSQIAARLGGSKGTLWSYFASKEVLFDAVIDRATLDFRRQLPAILNPEDDFATALRRFCTEFLNKITSPLAVSLHRVVVAETSRFPEVGRTFYERAPKAMQNLLAGFLADAMKRGLLRSDDPRAAARHLAGLCMSGSHQLILLGMMEGPVPETLEAEAEAATAAFLRGYAPSAAPAV